MIWSTYGISLAKDLSPFIAAGLIWASKEAATWLRQHTQNATLAAAITLGEQTMQSIVVGLNQETVNDLKAAGSWTKATGEAVKAKALTQWKTQAAATVQKTLTQAIPNLEGELTTWLEQAVAEASNKTTALKAAPKSTPTATTPPAAS